MLGNIPEDLNLYIREFMTAKEDDVFMIALRSYHLLSTRVRGLGLPLDNITVSRTIAEYTGLIRPDGTVKFRFPSAATASGHPEIALPMDVEQSPESMGIAMEVGLECARVGNSIYLRHPLIVQCIEEDTEFHRELYGYASARGFPDVLRTLIDIAGVPDRLMVEVGEGDVLGTVDILDAHGVRWEGITQVTHLERFELIPELIRRGGHVSSTLVLNICGDEDHERAIRTISFFLGLNAMMGKRVCTVYADAYIRAIEAGNLPLMKMLHAHGVPRSDFIAECANIFCTLEIASWCLSTMYGISCEPSWDDIFRVLDGAARPGRFFCWQALGERGEMEIIHYILKRRRMIPGAIFWYSAIDAGRIDILKLAKRHVLDASIRVCALRALSMGRVSGLYDVPSVSFRWYLEVRPTAPARITEKVNKALSEGTN